MSPCMQACNKDQLLLFSITPTISSLNSFSVLFSFSPQKLCKCYFLCLECFHFHPNCIWLTLSQRSSFRILSNSSEKLPVLPHLGQFLVEPQVPLSWIVNFFFTTVSLAPRTISGIKQALRNCLLINSTKLPQKVKTFRVNFFRK